MSGAGSVAGLARDPELGDPRVDAAAILVGEPRLRGDGVTLDADVIPGVDAALGGRAQQRALVGDPAAARASGKAT